MLQTKGLNAVNRKQFREALLAKGEALIDAENEVISPDIILARPSEKVVWDGNSFVTVPANEPAWHVDFETGEKVLLVEGEATNLFPNSSNFATLLAQTDTKLEYEDGVTAVYYANNKTTSPITIDFADTSVNPVYLYFDFKLNNSYFQTAGSVRLGRVSGAADISWGISVTNAGEVIQYSSATTTILHIIDIKDGWKRVVAKVQTITGITNTPIKVRGSGSGADTNNSQPLVWFRNVNMVQGQAIHHQSSPIITTGTAVTRAADIITYTGTPIATTQLIKTSSGTVATDSGLPLNTQEAAIQKLTKLPITLTELGSSRFNSGLDEEDYFEEIAP